MQWNRVKTILIVIFIIVNIYLLIHYFNSSQNGISVSPSVLDDTVSILQNTNINIDKRIIPTTAPEIRVFDVTNFYGPKESLAQAFLGDGYFKNDQSVFKMENKTLWVNEGNFDLIVEQENDPDISSLNDLSEESCRKYADSIINEYKLDGNYAEFISSSVENGVRTLLYKQEFDEKIVVDTSLSIVINEKGMSKMQGRNWLGDTIYEGSFISTRTAVEALVNFANNPKIDKSMPIEITGIDQGYYFGVRAPESKTITAIPVWRITTKNNGEYIYDARNITLIEK